MSDKKDTVLKIIFIICIAVIILIIVQDVMDGTFLTGHTAISGCVK